MTIAIDVRYFAAAAAGLGRTADRLEYPTSVTIGNVLADAEQASPTGGIRLGTVLQRCSFIVNGVSTRNRELLLADGDQLDVLPPFAGG